MTELHVQIPDEVADRLAAAAAERGTSSEDLAGEILAEQLPPRRLLSFASLGRSTSGQRATDDENMLAEGFGR